MERQLHIYRNGNKIQKRYSCLQTHPAAPRESLQIVDQVEWRAALCEAEGNHAVLAAPQVFMAARDDAATGLEEQLARMVRV